ncbi:MAG: hypothetical protein JO105_01800 [Hyphomicrobiales bacterium]|nr:hypothetical protein [Hyphomicrobiales bacterium]
MMSWIFALLGLLTAAAGAAAIAMGWPLVPLERGWTMVIAGAALGSGGLVCLAVAALMGETRRTRLVIERAVEEFAWSRPIERMSSTTLPPEPESVMPRRAETERAPAGAPSPHFEKVEPALPSMPVATTFGLAEPRPEARPAPIRQEAREEPKREPVLSPQAAPVRAASPRMEAQPLPSAPVPAASEVTGRKSMSTKSTAPDSTAPDSKAPETESQAEELQPARSFSVGTTTFVVFTDGTIEARTPKGARRFVSMEEVRSYLEESAAS